MTLEAQLLLAENEAARQRLLRDSAAPATPELVYRLCEEARRRMRVDVAAAARHADAAYAVARRLADKRALAEALRMKGHVSYLSGKYLQAASAYRRAIRILEKIGEHVDVGRTLSSALQTLIYLGRYGEALEWAQRARDIFERERDGLRLARLDSNIGNILHRQDRYEEALEFYRRAIVGLNERGDHESAAIALRNMAVCHADVHDFDHALEAYEEARRRYAENGLALLAAEVNDNIANLYRLQGEYARALALYQSSDVEERGNTYHAAVAKLDQSDLYLELNLHTEAGSFANDAAERFARLGMPYERAKALVNVGLASFRTGEPERALPLLARAASLSRREKNPGWEATIDFYRAVVLLELGKTEEARKAALKAQSVLDSSLLPGKTVLCSLVLAGIELLAGNPAQARRHCDRARDYGRGGTAPLSFQLHMASGRVAEAEGDSGAAWREYRAAHGVLEMLRGQLPYGELRVAFLKDKQLVYENLVGLAATGAVEAPTEELLGYVEQAKSRSLAESMALGAGAGRASTDERFLEAGAVRSVRRQLSWYYHQIDRAESSRKAPVPERMRQLRARIASCEEQLAVALTTLRPASPGPAPLESAAEGTLSGIQAALAPGTALLDYFAADGRLWLFVVTATEVCQVPLGRLEDVYRACRLLSFQMSRNSARPSSVEPNDQAWLTATQAHLRRLHSLLIEPALPWLPNGHWVVVPHGPLHRIPFHALHDGESYVIDRRTLSYAPSAMVYRLCVGKKAAWADDSMVFGVPDERAPHILDEVQAVADLLPQAQLFTGADATGERLRRDAVRSRFIHLATHGVFRQDNPLFSSINMGDSRVCLFDLYDFEFAAELITLSGCATGVHETVGADEVIGLASGLLFAGAHAVHLTMWEVNDRSTAEYMCRFYSRLQSGAGIAEALREAMLETRDRYAHPYFWAPFAVTGQAQKRSTPLFPEGSRDPVVQGKPAVQGKK